MDWWLWAIAGLVTLGIGIVVLLEPGNSVKALAVITGIYLLADSVLAFIDALGRHTESREMSAIHGVISLVVGIILVRHPIQSVSAIAIFIGIWLLTIGCIGVVAAFHRPDHVGISLVIALIAAAAGAIIIAQPHIGYNTLAIIAGISLALQGLGMIVLGFTIRSASD
jgi:uncharacterized membrane protein HdeD (DUF308 family)